MSKISGFNKTEGIKDVTITTDGNSHALDVNVISGGGGGSTSDTSAANQTVQIAEAQLTNTKLDTVITNQAGTSTEAKQDAQIASLQALITELQLKADATEKQSIGELHTLIPVEHDQITITAKTVDGPTVVEYRQATILVATLTLTYDIDGDVQNVVRT